MKRKLVTLLLPLCVALSAACAKSDVKSVDDGAKNALANTAATRVIRAPEVVRREGNLLAGSASEYLREHAHDPVDWRPWSDETIALAVAENKPIFLSIGYSACHFCHVMHDEVFSKDDVARVLNSEFISIKVDREERPDLDATYMEALSQFSSTGWPATLFLTPHLDPFFGATYVRHDRFLEVAQKAATLFSTRDAGSLSVVDIRAELKERDQPKGTALGEDEIRAIATEAISQLDPVHGGMKSSAKFPMSPRLSFLLHATRKWNLPELAALLRTTLDAMEKGSLRDPISSAFHRYTTDAAWTTPHYEVMLYDDAQLATLYFEAGAAEGNLRYTEIARETLDFLAREMTTDSGAFAASFDADTAGEEGAAWRWSESEIKDVVGKDGALVADILGVKSDKIAPSRRESFAEIALRLHVTESDVKSAWTRARPLLRAARAKVGKRDDKIVAAWNGLAITAFSSGFRATHDPRYRDVAIKAGDAVWSSHHDAKGALTRTPGGADAFASDYADLAAGYFALFEATSDLKWLSHVDALLHDAMTLEAKDGGFYEGRSDLGHSISLDDGPEPSATGAMLGVLVRRDAIGASDAWRGPFARAMTKYGNALRARTLGASAWIDAALTDVGPAYELVIAGNAEDAAPLVAVDSKMLPSWSVLIRVPAEGADANALAVLPALADKRGMSSGPTPVARAFLCERSLCKSPTTDPVILRGHVLSGWYR